MNLFMNLGAAASISISQTIFSNCLPGLLSQYEPGVDARTVLAVGATNIRRLVTPEQLPGLLVAYSKALTQMFVSFATRLWGELVLTPSASVSTCPLCAPHWRAWSAWGWDGRGWSQRRRKMGPERAMEIKRKRGKRVGKTTRLRSWVL